MLILELDLCCISCWHLDGSADYHSMSDCRSRQVLVSDGQLSTSEARQDFYVIVEGCAHHLEEHSSIHTMAWIKAPRTGGGSESHKTFYLSIKCYFVSGSSYMFFRTGLVMARPKHKRTSGKANPPSGKVDSRRSHAKVDTEWTRSVHNMRKWKTDSLVDDVDHAMLTKKDIPDILKAVMDAMPSSSTCQPLSEVESDIILG